MGLSLVHCSYLSVGSLQYVPPSLNLQPETNMDYRNDCVDWFAIGGFGDCYGSFFGV